jgi:mRNA interferase MazF
MTNPIRGEVWWVQFDPAVGEEIQKTRPAVVVNAEDVGKLELRIVVPITDWKDRYKDYLWCVCLSPDVNNGLDKEGAADCFQVKSVSVERFKEKIGVLDADQIQEITSAIGLCVGF